MASLKRLVLLVLCVLTVACSPLAVERSTPPFSKASDMIRCSTGGGDGKHDILVLRGDGRLSYQPLNGATVKRQLGPDETQEVYQRLVQAGLFTVTDVPNRAVEHFGVLLEIEVGGKKLRGTIGVLEMQKDKHRKWQVLLGVLTSLIEE